jgi:hypothetical protein
VRKIDAPQHGIFLHHGTAISQMQKTDDNHDQARQGRGKCMNGLHPATHANRPAPLPWAGGE